MQEKVEKLEISEEKPKSSDIKIETTAYSNILLIQPHFKQAIVLSERVVDENVLKSLIDATTTQNAILSAPQIVTKLYLHPFLQHKPFANLRDLFEVKDFGDSIFRVKAFVLGFQPADLREFCQKCCTECKFTTSYRSLDEDENVCSSCKAENCSVPVW